MKLKHYLLILLLCGLSTIPAQSFIPSGQIGTFISAKSFSINSAGFIYVADVAVNEIIKLDTLGKVVKSIGGYGWSESSFDNPVDIFATTLNVYVCDKNNNRIQFFDKDLNFLSEFSTQESDDDRIKFKYPICAEVSTQGDLYILDADDKRILKFNLRGEYQVTIGSYDAGMFALADPKQFGISSSTKIIVTDPPDLVIFDQFGNGIRKIQLPFSVDNINTTFENICVNNKSQIALFNDANLESGNINPAIFNPGLEDEIVDALIFNSKLYVLTKNTILIYKLFPSN